MFFSAFAKLSQGVVHDAQAQASCLRPMSAQQDQRNEQNQYNDQPLLVRQRDGQVVALPSQFRAIILALLRLILEVTLKGYLTPRIHRTPYHTSALSGVGWVHELLNGHPERLRNELGVYRSTFTLLIKALQALGLQSSHHVPIEEQLSIFLYSAVTGLSCTHVGERFQRSSDTITK